MIKIKNTIVTFLGLTLALSSGASTDIHGKGSVYIRVTHYPDAQASSFELCRLDIPTECAALDGKDLAKKTFENNPKPVLYKLRDLQTKHADLKYDVARAWLYDIGIGASVIVVSVATVGYGTLFMGSAFSSIGITSAVAFNSAVAITAAGVVVGDYIGLNKLVEKYEALNPIELARQVEVTEENLILDGVSIVDGDMALYAYSMNRALSSIKGYQLQR